MIKMGDVSVLTGARARSERSAAWSTRVSPSFLSHGYIFVVIVTARDDRERAFLVLCVIHHCVALIVVVNSFFL